MPECSRSRRVLVVVAAPLLDSAYTAGNTIGTDSGSNVIINLADVVTPTEVTINNLDASGTNALQIDNSTVADQCPLHRAISGRNAHQRPPGRRHGRNHHERPPHR